MIYWMPQKQFLAHLTNHCSTRIYMCIAIRDDAELYYIDNSIVEKRIQVVDDEFGTIWTQCFWIQLNLDLLHTCFSKYVKKHEW